MNPASETKTAGRTFRYHAFISYSHAADGQLAPGLQAGLQRFAKPWYRLRAIRIFHDQTGLSVTPELWGSIERALHDSHYFLLLASPQAAQSKWVEQEVDWWLRNRSADSLLIVQTDGDVAWDRATVDFDWTKTNALPRRLEKTFKQEPLYLDLRWARTNVDLSLRRPQFAEAIARLAATLRGLSLDEIIGEDVRQHQSTIRLLRFAAFGLIAVTASALFAAFIAIQAKKMVTPLAEAQQTNAVLRANEAISRQLATAALNQQSSDKELSILLAAEAVRIHPTAEAESALRQSLFASLDPTLAFRGHGGSGSYAVFSPDGAKVLTWGDEIAQIRDASTGKLLREFSGHTKDILQASFSRDGDRVCTAAEDDSVRLWDVASGNSVVEMHHPGVSAALLSQEGTRVLSLAMGGNAALWDAKTGTQVAELDYSDNIIFSDQVRDASFHPDGSRVAKCRVRDPAVFDAKTGKLLMELEGHTKPERSIAFSSDGNWLITASEDGTVRRWRVATGRCEQILEHGTELYDAKFSPDGRWIVARDKNKILLIWEAETGRKVATIEVLPKPEDPLIFTFSPDGRCLLTGSFDTSKADLWETRTGTRLAELVGEGGLIRTLHFSPDGKRAIVGNYDAPARIYTCDVCGSAKDLLALAGHRVSRQLRSEERQRYLAAPPIGAEPGGR